MTEFSLTTKHEDCLKRLVGALINQRQARVLVEPKVRKSGYWFGGGNLFRDEDGRLLIIGRYRNQGDSRTGTGAGTRGLELAIFASEDSGQSFRKVCSWSKQDLAHSGIEVVSIEGAALHRNRAGEYEVFVSTEKDLPYPEEVMDFLKPGAGVWSIDVFRGAGIETLDAATIEPLFDEQPPPEYLHVKDPSVFTDARGSDVVVFCDHPFSWSSANSGYAIRPSGENSFRVKSWEFVGRGAAWDVAGTRITNRMLVPRVGRFADLPTVAVYFYDGLECYRQLGEHPEAVSRPRGYSCEELGGATYGWRDAFPRMTRLSRQFPLFVSPHGTGCSRYVDTLVTEEGIHAIWQQSQPDLSQPLVGHFLPMETVEQLLD